MARAARTDMQWEYPWVLTGLLAVPGLAYLFAVSWRQKRVFHRAWTQVAYMRAHSMPPAAVRHYAATALFLSGFAFSVAGFASPVVQRTAWEPFWEKRGPGGHDGLLPQHGGAAQPR